MCSRMRLQVTRSTFLFINDQGVVMSAITKSTLVEEIFFFAAFTISSEKSTASTCFDLSQSHSVFFPVPQPTSLTSENLCFDKMALNAIASLSLVLFVTSY